MAAHILRVRRTDKSGQYLLVHVSSTSSKDLDLKLIATEHEHLYHAAIQDSKIKALQANNYSGDLQQWRDTLKYALLYEKPDGQLPDFLQGVELAAAISGKSLTVLLRNNVGGITQRLGSIKLEQDDEREEVSPFDWVDTAVANADDLRNQLVELQASVSGQQDAVAKLNQQLEELVQAKKEHEDEMLKKFAALLNAKKLKIRDQQRLLAGAKIDPTAAKQVSNARASGRGHQAEASRRGKRKSMETDEAEEENGNDEGEDEALDNDEMQQETPPRTEDEATEDEDDLDNPTTATSDQGKVSTAEASGKENVSQMEIDHSLPPRRELPFKKQTGQSAPAKQAEDDDETDDEL